MSRWALGPVAAILLAGAGCAARQNPYTTIDQDALDGNIPRLSADLDAGPGDLEHRDSAGRTPLALAVEHCRLDAIHLLLARGADPNSVAQGGATPLHFAAQEGCVDGIEALLAAHANLNARDELNRTPLARALQWHQAAAAADLQQHHALP